MGGDHKRGRLKATQVRRVCDRRARRRQVDGLDNSLAEGAKAVGLVRKAGAGRCDAGCSCRRLRKRAKPVVVFVLSRRRRARRSCQCIAQTRHSKRRAIDASSSRRRVREVTEPVVLVVLVCLRRRRWRSSRRICEAAANEAWRLCITACRRRRQRRSSATATVARGCRRVRKCAEAGLVLRCGSCRLRVVRRLREAAEAIGSGLLRVLRRRLRCTTQTRRRRRRRAAVAVVVVCGR